MTSIIKVNNIQNSSGTAAMTIDGSSNVTFPQNATVTGDLSVSGTMPGSLTLTNSGGVDMNGNAYVDFTGLPATIKRIQVNLYRCSASGTDTGALIRLGTSGGIITSGYSSISHWGGGGQSDSSGFFLYGTGGTSAINGIATINNMGNDRFISSHSLMYNASNGAFGGGYKDLGGTLTQLRVSLVSGGNFDFGRINIMYES